MSSEIAAQWANKTLLDDKALLFLLFMRQPETKNISNVKSLVEHFFHDDIPLVNEITEWLINSNGKHLTILLDGYDEASRYSAFFDFVNQLIAHKTLPECGLVITSRPAESSHLHGRVNCRAEILGFTEQSRLHFINLYIEKQEKEKQIYQINKQDIIEHNIKKQVETIQKVLKHNPIMNTLCYIPLNITMLLLCLTESEEEIDLPITTTTLYERFIIITIKRFLCTKPGHTNTIFRFEDLPHEYYQTFQQISKFAYSVSIDMDDKKSMQLVFELVDIENYCKNLVLHGNGLGLLKPASFLDMGMTNKYSSYNFLHKSIQEYMAAYHIASLPPSILSNLLNKVFWDSSYFNIWIMYVGITGGEQREFKQFLSGGRFKWFATNSSRISDRILNDKIKCLHLLRCAAEAQESKSLVFVHNEFKEKVIDLSNKALSEKDIKRLAVLLLDLPGGPWTLNLSRCNINNKCCKVLFEIFTSQTVTANIKTINISCNSISSENIYRLCHEIFKSLNTKEVILPIDALYTSATTKRVEQFMNTLQELVQNYQHFSGKLLMSYQYTNRLIVVYSDLTTVSCCSFYNSELNNNLAKKLQEIATEKLQSNEVGEIYFTHSIYQCHDVETLSYIMENFQQIKFSGLNMHSKGAYLLDNALKIDFQSENDPSTCLEDFLVAILQNSAEIHPPSSYLSLLSEKVRKETSNYLRTVSTVKVLNLTNNNLSDCVADDLELILSNNQLEELYLGGNSLHGTGMIKIAKALQYNSTLKVFDISNNFINTKAASSIGACLANKYKLKKLYLNGNTLQAEGIIRIMNNLHCTSLKIFDVSKNSIGNMAARSIANVLLRNTELEELLLSENLLKAKGIIEVVKGLRYTKTLKVLDISNNDIRSEAAVDIAYVLSKQAKLEKINLGKNNLQNGLIIVVRQLKRHPNLKVLDISSNNTSTEVADYLAAFLCKKNKLEKLYLGGNLVNIKILQALQKFSTLTALDISYTNIDNELKDNILQVLARNTKIQELNLGGNKMDFGNIVESLHHISSLVYFNVSNNNISDVAADSIANIISHNTKLQELYLNKNSLNAGGICIIMKVIKCLITLRVIDISSNHIGKEAVQETKLALSININIRELYLSDTKLQTNGAIEIARALKAVVTLSTLDLSSNEIGAEAANDIGNALPHILNLQKLYLGINNLQTAGITTVAKALQYTSELKVLDMSFNNIDIDAADSIATALGNKMRLEELYLNGNNLQAEGVIKIANNLRKISVLRIYDVSKNNISGKAAKEIAKFLSKELHTHGNVLNVEDHLEIANGLLSTLSLKVFKIFNNMVDSENAYHQDTYTLLHEAAATGNLKELEFLLRLGGNVDCCTSTGCTPLYLAVSNGHLDCVQMLLMHNADISIADKNGRSPVDITESNSQYALSKVLRSAGKFNV